MDISSIWTAVSYLGTGLGGAFLGKVVDAYNDSSKRQHEAKTASAAREAEAKKSETAWLRDRVSHLEGRVEQLMHQLDQTQEELAHSRERKAILTMNVERLKKDAEKAIEREAECMRLNKVLSEEVAALRTEVVEVKKSILAPELSGASSLEGP